MRTTTRVAGILVLCLMLLLSGCGQKPDSTPAGAAAASAGKKEIVIGFAVSETGKYSTEGNYIKTSYQLWAEHVNAAGGIMVKDLGRKLPVRLLSFDDQSDAQTAVKMYERLISKENVDLLLGPWGSGINFAVSALVDREGWPLIMPSASSDQIYERDFKTIFQSTTLASQMVQPIAAYLNSNPEIKTVALLYENFLLTQQQREYLLKLLKDSPAKLVMDEQFPLGGKEFGSLVSKLKAQNPDAVLFLNIMPSSIYFVRQLEEVKYRPKLLLAGISTGYKEFIDGVGAGAAGVLEIGFVHPEMDPSTRKVWEAYEKKFQAASNADTVHAYAAAEILHQAVEVAGSLDRKKVLEALHTHSFHTVMGQTKYDAQGRNLALKPFLAQWVNGKREIVWPAEVATAKLVYPAGSR